MMTNKGVKSITLTFGDGPSITHEVHDFRGQYCLPRDLIEGHDHVAAQNAAWENFIAHLPVDLAYYPKPKLRTPK